VETAVQYRKIPGPRSEAQTLCRIKKRKERAQWRVESKAKEIQQCFNKFPMKITTWNVNRVSIFSSRFSEMMK